MLARRTFLASVGGIALASTSAAAAKTIDIGIGHQSMCTDTYTAGIIVQKLGLLEKYLPHDGQYKDVKYNITWDDYTSGAPITNQMLADKLDFGVMGDYPLVVNGAKFQATDSLRSLYVAGTGYNLRGSGNGIVVPVKSDIYSFSQLKGRSVSTPIGSASWGMLIKALGDAHMPLDSISLRNQSPPVGAANIATGKIDAHADFCPWTEIMQFRGTGREIYDGSQTGVPYLHGLVVRKDFADKYPEIVIAFIKAIHDAGDWVNADPMRASQMMENWTGVEKEVLYIYFSKGGRLTLDPTIKPKWVSTLEYDHSVLQNAGQIGKLDFKSWIDDKFIREAYKEMHLDYTAEQAVIVDPKTANAGLPNEIWEAKSGIVTYPQTAGFLKAVSALNATGQKIDATYVYDHDSGLKLFGNTAFYVVASSGDVNPFLLRPKADAYAASVHGRVVDFQTAVSGAGS
ncbi:MAG TPA: ABC transporter substrate-binding protein [Acetobacteraceae bacterium]|jgi:NitT/TauT family transport system substrate-binding protein